MFWSSENRPEKLKDRLLQGANYNVEDVSEVGPAVDALGSIVYGNKISPEKVTDLSAEYVSGKAESREFQFNFLFVCNEYFCIDRRFITVDQFPIPICRTTDLQP